MFRKTVLVVFIALSFTLSLPAFAAQANPLPERETKMHNRGAGTGSPIVRIIRAVRAIRVLHDGLTVPKP